MRETEKGERGACCHPGGSCGGRPIHRPPPVQFSDLEAVVYRYNGCISWIGCLHTWQFWPRVCMLREQPRQAVWPHGWNRIFGMCSWQMVQGSGSARTVSSPSRMGLSPVASPKGTPASTFTVAVWPTSSAYISAVMPSSSTASTLALCVRTSALTVSACPPKAADISAVCPPLSTASTLA